MTGMLETGLANRVTAVIDKPNKDGDNVIEITLGDGSTFAATKDLGAAQILVEILQHRLVRWAHESAKNLRFPEYVVTDVAVAHKGPGAQLMVTTSQIGSVVLRMPDDVLRKTRQEIDRVLTYRSGSQKMQ
jgi:hypothetical protein